MQVKTLQYTRVRSVEQSKKSLQKYAKKPVIGLNFHKLTERWKANRSNCYKNSTTRTPLPSLMGLWSQSNDPQHTVTQMNTRVVKGSLQLMPLLCVTQKRDSYILMPDGQVVPMMHGVFSLIHNNVEKWDVWIMLAMRLPDFWYTLWYKRHISTCKTDRYCMRRYYIKVHRKFQNKIFYPVK